MTLCNAQVRHIKAKYGDYFGITVAGYPGKSQVSAPDTFLLAFLEILLLALIIRWKQMQKLL